MRTKKKYQKKRNENLGKNYTAFERFVGDGRDKKILRGIGIFCDYNTQIMCYFHFIITHESCDVGSDHARTRRKRRTTTR